MRALWIVLFLVYLSGCGFQSLYAVQNNTDVLEATEKINLLPIPNADGYQMSILLQTKLNPRHVSADKVWSLEVLLDKPEFYDQSIQGDNFASLEKITLTARYTLKDLRTAQVALTSTVSTSGSYNIVREPYATLMAKEKMRQSLIQKLADEIAVHIFAYMKGRSE